MRSLIGIALVVALALGAGWYFMVARGPGSVAVNAATSATTTITVEAAPVKLERGPPPDRGGRQPALQ